MAITKTTIKPLQGASSIVLHDVPQSITVENIIGDKGAGEVWVDTKGIEDFTATITTLDEYSTGVPYKKITVTKEFDTASGTWSEGEEKVEEAEEKTFTLNYKGHERDFEVKVVEGEGGEGGNTPLQYWFAEENKDIEADIWYFPTPPDEYIMNAGSLTATYLVEDGVNVEGDVNKLIPCFYADDGLKETLQMTGLPDWWKNKWLHFNMGFETTLKNGVKYRWAKVTGGQEITVGDYVMVSPDSSSSSGNNFKYFISYTAEYDDTYYILAVEEPPTEAYYAAPFGGYMGVPEDVINDAGIIIVATRAGLENFITAEEISELKGNYFAVGRLEGWASHHCYYYNENFELDTNLPIVPISSDSSSSKLYIRYRWGMNDAHDLSAKKDITITDYPASLEVDAHYEDNFGGHEIGDYTFNSARVTMKSGEVKDIDEDNLTIPESVDTWADKDGFQTQTWSYTENGRTATAQVGANITALKDVKIEASLGGSSLPTPTIIDVGGDSFYLYEIEPLKEEWKDSYDNTWYAWAENYEERFPSDPTFYTGAMCKDMYKDYGEYFSSLQDNKWYLESYVELPEDTLTDENLKFSNEGEPVEGSYLRFVGGSSPILKEGEVVSKADLTVTMTRNDGSTYVTTDYWMLNNYPFGKGKQSITVQRGSLSTTLPVTVAYVTKVEVGNIDEESEEFIKSSFYEYGEYVEPTHYKTYYECYDGSEGFDEIKEMDGNWVSKVESKTAPYYTNTFELNGSIGSTKVYEILGLSKEDECYDESWEQWCIFTEDDDRIWIGSSNTEGSLGYILNFAGLEPSEKVYYGEFYVDGELYGVAPSLNGLTQLTGQLYHSKIDAGGNWVKGDPLPMLPIGEGPKVIGEYGSEVGVLTINNKNYIYRAEISTPQEPSNPQESHGLGMGIRSWVASKAVVPYWLKCPVSSIPDISDVEGYNEITKEWELLEYLSNDEYGDNYILVDAMYSSLRLQSTQELIETERISGYVEDIQSSYFYISAEDFSELIEAVNGCATQDTAFYFYNFMHEYWVIIDSQYNGYYRVLLVHNTYEGEKVYDSLLTFVSTGSPAFTGSLEFTWDDTEGHIVNIIQNIDIGIDSFFNFIWERLNDDKSLDDYYDEELDSYVYYLPSSVIRLIFPGMDVDRAIFSSGEDSVVVEREGNQYKVTNDSDGLTTHTVEVDGVKYLWDMGVVAGLAVPCDYIEFNLNDKRTEGSFVYFPLSEKPYPYHEGYTPLSQAEMYVAFSKSGMQCFIAPSSVLSSATGIELSSEYWGALVFMGEPPQDDSKAYFMFMSDDRRSGGYFGGENGALINAG